MRGEKEEVSQGWKGGKTEAFDTSDEKPNWNRRKRCQARKNGRAQLPETLEVRRNRRGKKVEREVWMDVNRNQHSAHIVPAGCRLPDGQLAHQLFLPYVLDFGVDQLSRALQVDAVLSPGPPKQIPPDSGGGDRVGGDDGAG